MLRLKNMNLNNRVNVLNELENNLNLPKTNNELVSKWKKTTDNLYSYIVLNFDGTIRDKNDRNGPIRTEIVNEICRIASDKNTNVIIATGRKESGLKIVKECIDKPGVELQMILGNGSEIISFPSLKKIYSGKPFNNEEIDIINNCLTKICKIPSENIHIDKNMIRIFYDHEEDAANCINEIYKKMKREIKNCRVTHSGFNIEIVPYESSKEIALCRLIKKDQNEKVLAIGDAGWKHGNDFGLLSNYPSFCVGERINEFIKYSLPVINNEGIILNGTEATLFVLKNLTDI